MLYHLVQKRRGKEIIVMTGELSKVNDHMKKLRDSQRKGIKGQKVTYFIREAEEEAEKFKKKPYDGGQFKHRSDPKRIR